MRIGKLKKAWTIMQVLGVFDEHKQDYIDQHDYYRAGDFEHVRNHIGPIQHCRPRRRRCR